MFVYEQQNRFTDAIVVYDRLISGFLPHVDESNKRIKESTLITEPYLMLTLMGKAKCLFELNRDLMEALHLVDLASVLSEKLILSYVFEHSELDLGKHMRDNLETGVHICYRLFERNGNSEFAYRALNYSEKGKNQCLTKSPSQKARAATMIIFLPICVPSTPIFDYDFISLENELASLDSSDKELQRKYFTLREEYNSFTSRYFSTEAMLESEIFTWNIHSENINEIIRLNGQAIVELFLTETVLYSFVLQEDHIEFGVQDFGQDKRQIFSSWITVLKKPSSDPKTYNDLAFSAYQSSIQDILLKLDGSRFTIVSDGILWNAPFESMTSSDGSYASFSALPYLLNEWTINYSYSVGLLFHLKESERKHRSYTAFAPVFEQSKELAYLKGTDLFVQNLATIWNGEAFCGLEANKSNFMTTSTQSTGILHLYTHASGDAEDHLNSWVAFNNDKMFLNELLSLELNNRLTILQGCETGLGPYYGGEGITSLSLGFYAGRQP